jgi:hypothetical protein
MVFQIPTEINNTFLTCFARVEIIAKLPGGLGRVGNSSGDENGSDAMKYWEIIADNLSQAGFSWGCVSAIDSNGQTIWIADAQRGDGKP